MDRIERLEAEVGALKATVSELQSEVLALREGQRTARHPVEALLWQRGLPVMAHGDLSRTLLPPNLSPTGKERFYRLMRRYSFRLFLRDLIQFPEGADLKLLTRYCSLRTVRSYLKELTELGIVACDRERGYQLIPKQVSSFGSTLEWYVSEIFQREFIAPVLFTVRLEHTRYGGDYDVIAIVSGHLLYVEVKSSPPRGVELPSVSAFLKRLRDLQPQMAIFLVDTELRMKDKIAPLFSEALAAAHEPTQSHPVSRLINEIFHIRHGIYLVNSRKGIYSNLRYCIRDFLQTAKNAGELTCK